MTGRGSVDQSAGQTARICELFRFRWTVPILAVLHRSDGFTVAQLATRLHASRGGVRRSLEALEEAGLVSRASGHRHPLAPEITLTNVARPWAQVCDELEQLVKAFRVVSVARRKWCLPILSLIPREGLRFSDIRDLIPAITDRALSQALSQLESSELLRRDVGREGTGAPTLVYVPTRHAEQLRKKLAALPEY